MSPIETLQFNLDWMSFNIFLAVIPVAFGWMMVKSKPIIVKIIAGIIWFLFIPNTIYLLTDPINLFREAQYMHGIYLVVDIIMYAILLVVGVITYIICMAFFEKLLNKKNKKMNFYIISGLNLLVSFGIVLGRFQRVNSWEIISDTNNVIEKSFYILKSPDLLLWMLIFFVSSEVVYFYFGSFERLRQRVIAA